MITILIFLSLLAILILSHELGHFVTAKLFKVKVLEFGFGFPPRLVSTKRGETIFSLNLLPFGGFVKLLGEEDPTLPGSLAGKSILTRLIVLSSGSIMNILVPVILFTLSLSIPHNTLIEKVLIQEVAPNSPAQIAGIEVGDTIIKINDQPIKNRAEVSYLISLNLGSKIDILLQEPELSEKEVTITPRWKPPPGQGAIGIIITGTDSTEISQMYPIWKAIPLGARYCWEILVLFRNEVVSWFMKGTLPQMTGAVGIAQMTGEVAKAGLTPLMEFTALISLNLGIINLFPFPGLDGGRIIFVLLEGLRGGKRISPKKEGLVHLIGFIILVLLMLIVTYFDVIRLIRGESLFP